jgi:hypothetical protein
MVYQMPCPGSKGVFAASSEPNSDLARQELQGWAEGNGYQLDAAARTFTVYGRDQQPRQWVLLERAYSEKQSRRKSRAEGAISARSNTAR